MFSREGRFRLFLAFLILVLVLVNSQSLQVSHQSRNVLAELFESQSREIGLRIAAEMRSEPGEGFRLLTARLASIAGEMGLSSACILDWNARLLTGGTCAPPEGSDLDRLESDGRRELLTSGWSMTPVSPKYDIERARAFGYVALSSPQNPSPTGDILRIEVRAPRIAEANRRFRSTLIYQVSALSLVLLALVLFLNSLLAPQRRLVAEARSVASELPEGMGVDDGDEGEFLLTTFQEVVARLKEKERELQALHQLEKARADETEALASDIIRSMTTGLVSLDPSGAVVLVNPAAERIFGVASENARSQPFDTVFPGSQELRENTREALEQGTYHLRGQTLYEKNDGEVLHLGVSVIPLLSLDGGIKGALCLLADLTEVVELRERLFLKENLARLGEMVAGIAHEFRNGLSTIMGNAKLLKDSTEAESHELVDALLAESQSLARVVTEFLQFARPEALQLETIDLGALLEELIDDLSPRAREEGVRLWIDKHSDVSLQGDEPLLRKAFQNLIVNAVESLATAGVNDGEVCVEVDVAGGQATARVRDNGPGVPSADREKVFTPFYTGKADGTGLGLSVVQKIAVSHNGTVELESTPRGASFIVSLPLTPDSREFTEDWV